MSFEIFTASAGTGKTTKLAELMEAALLGAGVPRCRPEGIIATTFTRKAAGQLREKARARLLEGRHTEMAGALGAACIGTVDSVCGRIVSDFALELGLSPQLRVLDDAEASAALAQCLAARAGDVERADALNRLAHHFTALDWQSHVQQIVQLARANGLDAAGLEVSRARSIASLLELLGERHPDGAALDDALMGALRRFVREVDGAPEPDGKARSALHHARAVQDALDRGERPRWSDWVRLANLEVGEPFAAVAADVIEAAGAHDRHPALRDDLARAVGLVFEVAARAIEDFQNHKRARGVIDFIDQEVMALQALALPSIREELGHRLDLVVVDEFQDSSPLQLAIFLKLSELAPRTIWVGDPKQAIYGFRGTDSALMRGATAQLEDPGHDGAGELVERMLAGAARRAKVSVLEKSWRSRPPLVEITSALFAEAFVSQGIPPEHTKIEAGVRDDPAELGPCLGYWALRLADNRKTRQLPKPVAAAVRACLDDPQARVREPSTNAPRALTARDIGILCRTKQQCRDVAAALAHQGIGAQVPQMGLLGTLEGCALMAALHLWRDPDAPHFRARLARLLGDYADPQAWTEVALAGARGDAFAGEASVRAIVLARAHNPTVDPVAALDLALDASGLRERCLEWGNTPQRLANLDVVRGEAVAFAQEAVARGEPCTLAGLLFALERRHRAKEDACALAAQDDAVAVSTWHAAKGLEWPVVVLFGIERPRSRPGRFFGARVESPLGEVDLEAPLAGRWIRYWCTPYHSSHTRMPLAGRLEKHPLAVNADLQANREELRLLYVGWTRARDRLILACHQHGESFAGGIHRHLATETSPLAPQPSGPEVTWRKKPLPIAYAEPAEAKPQTVEPRPGSGYDPPTTPRRDYPPARLQPSARREVGRALQVWTLGEPLRLKKRAADMARLGQAMHAFLAADRSSYPVPLRRHIAHDLLGAWSVAACLEPDDLLEASDRLRAWAQASWQPTDWLPEVPLHELRRDGSRIGGRADLVLGLADGGYVLVDHKTLAASPGKSETLAQAYAGQLAAYREVIETATRRLVRAVAIHAPLAGVVVELGEGGKAGA